MQRIGRRAGSSCAPGRLPRRLRALVVTAAAVVLVLVGAGPALAHARLRGSDPAAAATVTRSPGVVRLAFTEVVEPGQSQVVVSGPDGRPLPATHPARDPRDATVLLVPVPAQLAKGTYTVSWRVLSVDGHPVSSTFRFAVGAGSTPLTVTTGSGFGPTLLGGTGRVLSDVGLLALVGLTAFPLLVVGPGRRGRPRLPDDAVAQVRRRLRPLLAGSVLLALAGNVLLAVDTVGQSRGFLPGQIGSHLGELGSFLGATRTGRLLWLREAGLLVLAWSLLGAYRHGATGRTTGRAAGRAAGAHFAAAVALLATVSLASHAGTAVADSWLSVAVDWSHLTAAGVWTGGLLALAVAGLPAARALGRVDPAAGADQAGIMTSGFSDLAQVAMLVVFATGTYEALVHVSGLNELGRTAWGGELVVKLALWATVMLIATANTMSLLPRISRRAGSASARLAASGELATVVRFEIAMALALIAVAAVLAGTAPPDQLS